MSKYKWATPYEWIEQKSQDWTRERLLTEFLNLACITDSDTLQYTFQSEMDEDGYFAEIAGEGEGGTTRTSSRLSYG